MSDFYAGRVIEQERLNPLCCEWCGLEVEWTAGKAWTGWIHSKNGQLTCPDGKNTCTPEVRKRAGDT